jgi:hypothetical protein
MMDGMHRDRGLERTLSERKPRNVTDNEQSMIPNAFPSFRERPMGEVQAHSMAKPFGELQILRVLNRAGTSIQD